MDPFALTVVAVGLAGAVASIVASVRGRFALTRVWLEAARQASLEDIVLQTKGRWPVAVEGRHGALAVRIESRLVSRARRMSNRVVVSGLTRRLEMHPSVLFRDGGRRRDIRVGDNAFDAEVFVSGETAVASALLDGRTRDLVRNLFARRAVGLGHNMIEEKGVFLRKGELVSERSLADQPEWVAAQLRDLIALASRLTEPSDLPARLVANAVEDRNPAVRRTSLLQLVEQADRTAALPGLRRALEDADEDVRLEAALALGAEGHSALLEIVHAEVPLDTNVARAVRALGAALPVEDARAVLARALRARHLLTAAACLESLGHRGPEQAPLVARVLEMERGDVAIAAARVLGRIGVAASIPLLHDAEDRVPPEPALGKVSREAIAAIQSRLSGAEAGQVSLAIEEQGRVSLERDEVGQLSLATGRKGSPPPEDP